MATYGSMAYPTPGYVVTGLELNNVAGGGNRRMLNGVRAICHLLLP